MPKGSLFDPDTGLMVVGNGIFHAPAKVLKAEYRDPKWWKYPGNFHMRGKDWERDGMIQLISPDGSQVFQTKVAVRINGQMTRAFPQHALRLGFDEPLMTDLFGDGARTGYRSLILRAAGNDQIKAMLRDAFQHGLCAGLPFEVSPARTCVVYINGAYWGVHHLRPRMDEDELARRYGIRKKDITILEDEARLYHGDTMQVVHFESLANRTAAWDGSGTAWSDTLEARLDIDGFFAYMSTQMILGNMDWPSQNVRFWRYAGKPRSERPLDGRWYFIMGDSDLGYGAFGPPSSDMFTRINALDVPISKLFHGMMRNAPFRARFIATARRLAQTNFSSKRSTEQLEVFVDRMAPEMAHHTARWRRPATVSSWQAEVAIVRTFAREREAHVLRQLIAFERQQQ